MADTYTYDQVSSAINRAADAILEATDAGDTGLRDAMGLMVNATLTFLQRPRVRSLRTVVADNYDGPYGEKPSLEDVIEWITERCS
jgi:hypothetical protein